MNTIEVSKPMAIFFKELCIGETSGHMAMIANNPTIHAFCSSHGVRNSLEFAELLAKISERLKENNGR